MGINQFREITMWIAKELTSMDHGNLHAVLKIRDGQVALVEKTKTVKESQNSKYSLASRETG